MGQCYEKNESNEVIIREIGPVIRTGYTVTLTFFYSLAGPKFYYIIYTVSAAPKPALWGGPGPRYEPGPGGP